MRPRRSPPLSLPFSPSVAKPGRPPTDRSSGVTGPSVEKLGRRPEGRSPPATATPAPLPEALAASYRSTSSTVRKPSLFLSIFWKSLTDRPLLRHSYSEICASLLVSSNLNQSGSSLGRLSLWYTKGLRSLATAGAGVGGVRVGVG